MHLPTVTEDRLPLTAVEPDDFARVAPARQGERDTTPTAPDPKAVMPWTRK
jgi:hypothetical protein